MYKNIFLLLALSSFTACISYQEKPIALQENTQAWEKISQEFSRELNLQDSIRIGLILNMELNIARAQYAKTQAVEKEAGWWNDPSLSLGITRKYTPEWQTNLSPGIGFTLPVTGIPSLQKEVAAHYREADYWKLVQLENEFVNRLEKKFASYVSTKLKCDLSEKRIKVLKDELKKVSIMVEAGEISPIKQQLISSRLSSTLAILQELKSAAHTSKLALLQEIGLHPAILNSVEFIFNKNAEIPNALPVPTAEELLALPKIREQLAIYKTSESELKLEIRKQYPELSISPGLEFDGDSDKSKNVSIGIGLDLPLWNRNKQAIAEAQGSREIKYLEALKTWREQLFTAQELKKRQNLAILHCNTEKMRLKKRINNSKLLDKSLELGEAEFPDVSEARQETFSAHLTFIDSKAELYAIQSDIRALFYKPQKNF